VPDRKSAGSQIPIRTQVLMTAGEKEFPGYQGGEAQERRSTRPPQCGQQAALAK
jgi:hypothetical protein